MKYAHSMCDPVTKELLPKEKWHPLNEHLRDTAGTAAKHADYFQCGSMGSVLGYNHDYGKNLPDFQKRLEGLNEKINHKTAGTLLVYEHYPFPYGLIMAYAVYGHHGGLPNHISQGSNAGLEEVLRSNKFRMIDNEAPVLPELVLSSIPKRAHSSNPGISFSLWIRMLYSALIDADYLDAESYFQPDKTALRNQFPSITKLHTLFQPILTELMNKPQDTAVAKARRYVLESCLRAATGPKGFYTLSAPTGSGKTYASLAFALEHAKEHDMRRIIVALPFQSIIEQTAAIFRGKLGDNTVLEHHSNVVFCKDRENEIDPKQLASENWEANLIVTTNVQLFESLFSAKPSRARKLHNLAGSVIILDEAQALPDELLLPSLAALQCLCADYGVTVLFCTATQPAIDPKWLDGTTPTEIISNPPKLYRDMKRVNVSNLGKKSEADLVNLITSHSRALCIVNSRKQAQKIYRLIQDKKGVFHLSALMCANHRSQTLDTIREMPSDRRCLVIATSLVEAGVDLDFPVVYRELSGIESVAQAAGRCNREGNMERGDVYLFEFADQTLRRGWFSARADLARVVLDRYPDPLEPEAVHYYFQLFYGLGNKLDQYNILRDLNRGAAKCSFQFRQISETYKFIKEDTVSVVIPYDSDARKRLGEARSSLYPASDNRKLQRYVVSLYPKEVEQLQRLNRLATIGEAIYYLTSEEGGIDGKIDDLYDDKLGLHIQPEEEG